MPKIALCDDDPIFLNKAEPIILEFNQTHTEDVRFQVEKYTSPRLLRDEILDGRQFDVFLLDMEMEELSGIEVAATVRENIPLCIIGFLSSHTDFIYTQEGYKLQALRYISKLMMETALVEFLEAAVKQWGHEKGKYYVYSHYSESIRIPLRELLYICRVKRTAVIHTARQGKLPLLCPLKTIFEELSDPRFTYVNQSCIVNIHQIIQLEKTEVTLRDGTRLPVSRKMMPTVKLAILRLWGELV